LMVERLAARALPGCRIQLFGNAGASFAADRTAAARCATRGPESLAKLNAEHKRDHPGESEPEARIQNYELAARMQLAATEVLDLSKETEATKKLYGLDN